MPATPCGHEGIDPCDNPIRCRRPAGHRADDGGPGWHSNGPIFWNDDTALTWGDETSDGPFTPAMPDDELPETEGEQGCMRLGCRERDGHPAPCTPDRLPPHEDSESTLKAGKRAETALTAERDDLAQRLADSQAALSALVAQVRTARAQWVEDIKDAAAGLEAAVKSGYAQALVDVSALCEARAVQHEAVAKHGFAHEARDVSKDVTKRLPLAGTIDGSAGANAAGYAQALKNVREYKWPHRGGPTEAEFGDFYAAIEAASG